MVRAAGTVLALSLLAGGCTDVCDEAVETLRERCEIETDRDPDVECSGTQRAYSECIVDHPSAACDYYDDPVAHGDNDFARCIAAIE